MYFLASDTLPAGKIVALLPFHYTTLGLYACGDILNVAEIFSHSVENSHFWPV